MTKKKERRSLPPAEPVEAIPEVLKRDQKADRSGQMAKYGHKRDRSWDANRSKATYDLPADLIERIRQIAAELGEAGAAVRVSDVARLLLEAGLVQYESGQLDVTPKPTGYKLFDD